jgi:hypothetical protein
MFEQRKFAGQGKTGKRKEEIGKPNQKGEEQKSEKVGRKEG